MTTGRPSIDLVSGRLTLGERTVPLLSGEVQYWRTPPEAWPEVLDRVVDLGIPIVSTYLSWRRHEPEQGRFQWGAEDPRLDLRRFLQLCAARDLFVQLKPGPWICAEETGGGYPDWLMARTADLALGAGGKPCLGYNTPFEHPVPSMHAPGYLAAARDWLRAVWRQVGDFGWPNGPVFAVQLDNEPSMAFQDSLYFADYHPLAIARFRTWLEDHYHHDVDAWQTAWGEAAAEAFTLAEPPRPDVSVTGGVELVGTVGAPTPVAAVADRDWLSFIEDSLVEHLAYLRGIHQEAGMGHLLATVNLIPNVVHEAPLRHRRVRERLGGGVAVGVDHYYDPPMSWPLVSCLARTAAAARAAGEPLVWAPEMMAGIWRSPGEAVEYPDPTPQEQSAWWGAAIAVGYRGFNFYMLVNRENWELAPISAAAELTAFAAPLKRLGQLLTACPEMLEAQPFARVAVATHRPYLLDAHTTVGTMRQPVVPWADGRRRVAYDAWDDLVTRLVKSSIPYELWDTDRPAPPVGTVVLVPQAAPIPPESWDRLEQAGCVPVEVQDGADPGAIPEVSGTIRVECVDPSTQVLAAIHFVRDQRILHVVRWGGPERAAGGRMDLDVGDWPDGHWEDVISGAHLPQLADGSWGLPRMAGHSVFRWVARSE